MGLQLGGCCIALQPEGSLSQSTHLGAAKTAEKARTERRAKDFILDWMIGYWKYRVDLSAIYIDYPQTTGVYLSN